MFISGEDNKPFPRKFLRFRKPELIIIQLNFLTFSFLLTYYSSRGHDRLILKPVVAEDGNWL